MNAIHQNELRHVSGGSDPHLFWDAVRKIESLTGWNIWTPDDVE